MIRAKKKQSQEMLYHLSVFAAFLLVLAFALGASPVYAPPPQPDRPIDPGGGPVPSTIEGTVIDYSSGTGVPGMVVYLYVNQFYTMTTTTSSGGVFHFQDNGIQWRQDYILTVNGPESSLGISLYDVRYCQMRVKTHTDDIGYANLLVRLDTAKEVKVPAATFYSNTEYTDHVDYSTGSSHDLSFHSLAGGTGFQSSQTWMQGISWGTSGVDRSQYARRYYAAAVYDGTSGTPFIASAGITAEVDQWEVFHSYPVSEYLTPNLNEPNYGLPSDAHPISFVIYGGQHADGYYEETSSYTWSYGLSGSVGITFCVFSMTCPIDVTGSVSNGHTNEISFKVGPLPAGELNHKFVVYTRGFSFEEHNNDPGDSNNRGGLELHIWDMGWVP